MAKKQKSKPKSKTTAADQVSTAVAEKRVKKKAAAPKKKKPTKAHLEELEEAAELLSKIEAAEEACQTARLDMEDAKESYKLAKQSYNHHVDELRRLVRARKEEHPLFAEAEKKEAAAAEKTDLQPQATAENETAPAASTVPSVNGKAQAWRYLEVDRLAEAHDQVQEKHLKALRASKFEALGELADLMQRRESFWHKEVKGIGKDGKVPIEDALSNIRARYELEATSEPTKTDEAKTD